MVLWCASAGGCFIGNAAFDLVPRLRWYACMTNQILSLALDEVTPDPEQPRQHFDREAMEGLKGAIFAMGQLQPIRVRRAEDRWVIVDGQRRWLSLCALAKQHPENVRFEDDPGVRRGRARRGDRQPACRSGAQQHRGGSDADREGNGVR